MSWLSHVGVTRDGPFVILSRGLHRVLDVDMGALALLAVFVAIDADWLKAWLLYPSSFGVDAAIYRAAADAWIHGADPWAVSRSGWYFAGPPPNLVLSLPFAFLDELTTRALWIAGSFGAALYSVRRLQMPLWWVLFPPLFVSAIAGNPNPLVLALLLAGRGPAAVFVKVFAAVPLVLLGRWRELVWASVALVVTIPLLPWGYFVRDLDRVQAIIVGQGQALSAWGTPLVIPVAVVVLMLRKRGAWLAVPALWPYSQIHYASLAVPGTSRWVAAALSFSTPLAPALAVAIAAFQQFRAGAIRVREQPAGTASER